VTLLVRLGEARQHGLVQSRERDRVCNLARSNPGAALEAARRLEDPLMRCQALTAVVRHVAGDKEALRIAAEADRSLEHADPYHATAGASWPMRALIDRGLADRAEAILKRALSASKQIPRPASQVDALFLLVQAGWPSRTRTWQSAVDHLVACARSASSTKAESVLRDLCLMLAGEGKDHTPVLTAIPEGKARRQVERRLAAREFMAPRAWWD
jgi:hypothetical protein